MWVHLCWMLAVLLTIAVALAFAIGGLEELRRLERLLERIEIEERTRD